MVVEIALEGTGLGQRLDERVQKVHCLLLSWCRNRTHPEATVDAAARRKILASGIEGGFANGTSRRNWDAEQLIPTPIPRNARFSWTYTDQWCAVRRPHATGGFGAAW